MKKLHLNNRKKIFSIFLVVNIVITVLFLVFSNENSNLYFFIFNSKNSKLHDQKSIQKWIVVITSLSPTKKMEILSKKVGFQLLVVGNKKTSKKWYKFNDYVFLSLEDQSNFGFKSYPSIPLNSYSQKNIGYLYAIKNGAKFIFDTDDDSTLDIDLDSFIFDDYDKGLIYDHTSPNRFINPYAHFGQPSLFPKGYPLDEIFESYNNSYIAGIRKVSSIQQGILNGDPDLDVIFPFKKNINQHFEIEFDQSAPSFQVPLYKMAPYDTKNILINYKAFWSLYLPTTLPFSVGKIWRSFWTQRLMWLLNETVSYSYLSVYKSSKTQVVIKNFEEGSALTKSFVDFLFEWKCLHYLFYDCMIQLAVDMAEENFWDKSEIDSLKSWIFDLKSTGYQEPKIINFENTKIVSSKQKDYHLGDFDYTRIRFSPEFLTPNELITHINNQSLILPKNVESFIYFKDMCKKYGVTLGNNTKNSPKKENYSLLVTFNHEPIVENIIILSHLYQRRFKNLIFCGSKIIDKLRLDINKNQLFDKFTFIEIGNSFGGIYHYFCMNKAIEIGYNTHGFLLISDDVFLKYWNMRKFNLNNVWFPFDMILSINPNEPIKEWGHSIKGFPNLLKTWNELEEIAKQNNASNHELNIIKNYFRQIDKNQNPNSNLMHIRKIKVSGSDIFYVPKAKFSDFYLLSKVFRKYDTFLEIALPNLLAGIESNKSIQIIKGHYDWIGVPLNFDKYENYEVFYHPFKLSKLKNDEIGSNYCKYYLSQVYEFN